MEKAFELLKKTRVRVASETYSLISLTHEDYRRLLEQPELSPRGTTPFMLFVDKFETTLLLDETDWQMMRHAARSARVANNFRLVTFDLELDLETVGYLAAVTEILARAGVAVAALSAFSRDHLLIKQENLAAALKALGPWVDELC